ncbi:MAG: hypothetical protein RLZZ22_1305 [Pseudomonadota bacterium]
MTRKTTWARRQPAADTDPRFASTADLPATAPGGTSAELRVQPQGAASQSPAAKAFRRELARFERLKTQLADMNRHCQAHKINSGLILQPLRERHRGFMREMVLTLDPWLDVTTKGLSKAQQATARDLVCSLAEALAQLGEADMAELHDRRHPQTLKAKASDDVEHMRRLFQEMFGVELPRPAEGDDPEAMLRAAMERRQAEAAEKQEREEARRQARQAKRQPTAAQQKAAQALQDADAMLRSVYRQLASALHPDRAPDETERARMNTLMSEANAAYGRKDLVTLLNLQLQAELVDPDHLDRLSDERLKSLTLLLKQQVAELERERQLEQERWLHELNLPPGFPLMASPLQAWLQDQQDELTQDLLVMQDDLATARNLATLKPWLTEQRRLAKRTERRLELDFSF